MNINSSNFHTNPYNYIGKENPLVLGKQQSDDLLFCHYCKQSQDTSSKLRKYIICSEKDCCKAFCRDCSLTRYQESHNMFASFQTKKYWKCFSCTGHCHCSEARCQELLKQRVSASQLHQLDQKKEQKNMQVSTNPIDTRADPSEQFHTSCSQLEADKLQEYNEDNNGAQDLNLSDQDDVENLKDTRRGIKQQKQDLSQELQEKNYKQIGSENDKSQSQEQTLRSQNEFTENLRSQEKSKCNAESEQGENKDVSYNKIKSNSGEYEEEKNIRGTFNHQDAQNNKIDNTKQKKLDDSHQRLDQEESKELNYLLFSQEIDNEKQKKEFLSQYDQAYSQRLDSKNAINSEQVQDYNNQNEILLSRKFNRKSSPSHSYQHSDEKSQDCFQQDQIKRSLRTSVRRPDHFQQAYCHHCAKLEVIDNVVQCLACPVCTEKCKCKRCHKANINDDILKIKNDIQSDQNQKQNQSNKMAAHKNQGQLIHSNSQKIDLQPLESGNTKIQIPTPLAAQNKKGQGQVENDFKTASDNTIQKLDNNKISNILKKQNSESRLIQFQTLGKSGSTLLQNQTQQTPIITKQFKNFNKFQISNNPYEKLKHNFSQIKYKDIIHPDFLGFPPMENINGDYYDEPFEYNEKKLQLLLEEEPQICLNTVNMKDSLRNLEIYALQQMAIENSIKIDDQDIYEKIEINPQNYQQTSIYQEWRKKIESISTQQLAAPRYGIISHNYTGDSGKHRDQSSKKGSKVMDIGMSMNLIGTKTNNLTASQQKIIAKQNEVDELELPYKRRKIKDELHDMSYPVQQSLLSGPLNRVSQTSSQQYTTQQKDQSMNQEIGSLDIEEDENQNSLIACKNIKITASAQNQNQKPLFLVQAEKQKISDVQNSNDHKINIQDNQRINSINEQDQKMTQQQDGNQEIIPSQKNFNDLVDIQPTSNNNIESQQINKDNEIIKQKIQGSEIQQSPNIVIQNNSGANFTSVSAKVIQLSNQDNNSPSKGKTDNQNVVGQQYNIGLRQNNEDSIISQISIKPIDSNMINEDQDRSAVASYINPQQPFLTQQLSQQQLQLQSTQQQTNYYYQTSNGGFQQIPQSQLNQLLQTYSGPIYSQAILPTGSGIQIAPVVQQNQYQQNSKSVQNQVILSGSDAPQVSNIQQQYYVQQSPTSRLPVCGYVQGANGTSSTPIIIQATSNQTPYGQNSSQQIVSGPSQYQIMTNQGPMYVSATSGPVQGSYQQVQQMQNSHSQTVLPIQSNQTPQVQPIYYSSAPQTQGYQTTCQLASNGQYVYVVQPQQTLVAAQQTSQEQTYYQQQPAPVQYQLVNGGIQMYGQVIGGAQEMSIAQQNQTLDNDMLQEQIRQEYGQAIQVSSSIIENQQALRGAQVYATTAGAICGPSSNSNAPQYTLVVYDQSTNSLYPYQTTAATLTPQQSYQQQQIIAMQNGQQPQLIQQPKYMTSQQFLQQQQELYYQPQPQQQQIIEYTTPNGQQVFATIVQTQPGQQIEYQQQEQQEHQQQEQHQHTHQCRHHQQIQQTSSNKNNIGRYSDNQQIFSDIHNDDENLHQLHHQQHFQQQQQSIALNQNNRGDQRSTNKNECSIHQNQLNQTHSHQELCNTCHKTKSNNNPLEANGIQNSSLYYDSQKQGFSNNNGCQNVARQVNQKQSLSQGNPHHQQQSNNYQISESLNGNAQLQNSYGIQKIHMAPNQNETSHVVTDIYGTQYQVQQVPQGINAPIQIIRGGQYATMGPHGTSFISQEGINTSYNEQQQQQLTGQQIIVQDVSQLGGGGLNQYIIGGAGNYMTNGQIIQQPTYSAIYDPISMKNRGNIQYSIPQGASGIPYSNETSMLAGSQIGKRHYSNQQGKSVTSKNYQTLGLQQQKFNEQSQNKQMTSQYQLQQQQQLPKSSIVIEALLNENHQSDHKGILEANNLNMAKTINFPNNQVNNTMNRSMLNLPFDPMAPHLIEQHNNESFQQQQQQQQNQINEYNQYQAKQPDLPMGPASTQQIMQAKQKADNIMNEKMQPIDVLERYGLKDNNNSLVDILGATDNKNNNMILQNNNNNNSHLQFQNNTQAIQGQVDPNNNYAQQQNIVNGNKQNQHPTNMGQQQNLILQQDNNNNYQNSQPLSMASQNNLNLTENQILSGFGTVDQVNNASVQVQEAVNQDLDHQLANLQRGFTNLYQAQQQKDHNQQQQQQAFAQALEEVELCKSTNLNNQNNMNN